MVFLLYAGACALKPRLSESIPVPTPGEVEAATSARDATLDPPGKGPLIWREVDYAEGPAASWWPEGEAPVLAGLVSEGLLPPVAERVGPQPAVLEGVDGLGRYGGTWVVAANAVEDIWTVAWLYSASTLVRWSPQGPPIVPHIAKAWDVSPDRREWTFHLRPGMRWSDGHPFTADDILYWWEWEIKYLGLPVPTWMRVGDKPGEIVKVDAHTVRFVFPEPNGLFLDLLPFAWDYCAPRHYLSRYHPELGDPDLIAAALTAQRLPSADRLYDQLRQSALNLHFLNPEYPRLWPWVYRSYQATPPHVFVRNPYYFAVDSAGNQLPYVDRLHVEVKAQNLIALSAANGGLTLQPRLLRFEDYTLLMSQRRAQGYEVLHWYPADRSLWALWPNLNRHTPPDDPVAGWKDTLLNDIRFRQALSLAINRPVIVSAVYQGVGEPAQVSPGPASFFHHPRLHSGFTGFDPDTASALLDELGLRERDNDGYRTFPDGTRMTWFIHFGVNTGVGPAQFVVADWARVGIRAIPRERSRALLSVEMANRTHDFLAREGLDEFNPLVKLRSFVPDKEASNFARGYGLWFALGGLQGADLGARASAAIKPPAGHPLRAAQELVADLYAAADPEAQRAVLHRILDLAADNLWSINIATPPPVIAVVKDGFRNVPRRLLYGTSYMSPANAGLETFYFESAHESPGAQTQLRQQMLTIAPAPESVEAMDRPDAGGALATIIRRLLLGILVISAVLAGVRHPYIGRRLLLMVPTLLVISVIAFTVIQLPPGDYLQAKLLELQMKGDDSALNQMEDLRRMFHLDRPVVERYARWLGLPWFITFAREDAGLLQGHMGRSMETLRSVNELVGDRILLTVLVSVGTILLTWGLALPIGIYSAVRRYTFGDYLVTGLGFLGMCIPNFLLALILIFVGSEYLGLNLTGLFSPEFATRPEWDGPKILDLLKHIWVPVVVLGVGGTAAMIRVMRANLLDELRKPYVTTARAKGVRPLRLLLKYPVRLALNPFVSGLGGLFPQLISGGAIVALVLSLPTVGPLMLSAFLSEDLYLAGSMLMVLSLLSVLGTLASDLVLLWLDPRIRLEGGSR